MHRNTKRPGAVPASSASAAASAGAAPSALLPLLVAVLLLAAAPLFAACAAASEPPEEGVAAQDEAGESEETGEAEEDDTPVLTGEVTRSDVEETVPEWVAEQVESAPDSAAVEALTEVTPGAEVSVYFGTWCSDSKRELARLWRGFDDAGVGVMAELPFALEYVAVDRDKSEPADRLEGMGIEYVPTFVVRRDGAEVGRVVEISPNGIEHDLLALLNGEAEGVVSGREDLGGAGREAILGEGDDEGDDDADGEGAGNGDDGAGDAPQG